MATTTMVVEQGTCAIYPTKQLQFCSRVRVIVQRLKPDDHPEAAWVDDGTRPRNVELLCCERGLARLLTAVDNGTKAPTPRPRKAKADEG